LRNPYFFDRVFSIVSSTGMAPGDMELEIDEIMFSDGEEVATNNLLKFRQAGFRIALNDFGKGFTSLGLLHKFKVDRAKIDRSFIAQLSESPDISTHSTPKNSVAKWTVFPAQ
jgi:EAL domain-containing protein (putative c-di-GMP-specific phosphodiesterase class I)